MAICVCVLKSEQKEEELSPMLFHSTYSTQSSRNLSQNKEEKNKTRTHMALTANRDLSRGMGVV